VAIVCLLLALILLAGARWTDSRTVRSWMVAWCLINAGVAAHMAATGYPYAWRLMPAEAVQEPGYRR
jgi:hypothetical protein